ncbi:MAG: biopolymer transporter ExbD, partial [Flavobacteriales bacterium]|nr:biopolymer transporter ExbD [Flavobacteriales bacterium]
MSKFRKNGKKSQPAVNTAALPDIVFMLLFFFMVTTTMRETTLKVENKIPFATEIEK